MLAKEGAHLTICDVNQETLDETKEMLRKYNVSVSSLILDVADKEAVEALPQKVLDDHGKVDMVFNNAGVTTGKHFADMEEKDWDWVMDINLNGVINSTRAFIPHLKNQPEAAIVNTSSIFGMVAVPGQTVYHATKFAVRGFTESLALEMAETNENLQVHCVHPGHVGTNIVSNSRMDEEAYQEALEEGTNRRSIFTRNQPANLKKWQITLKKEECIQAKQLKLFLMVLRKIKEESLLV